MDTPEAPSPESESAATPDPPGASDSPAGKPGGYKGSAKIVAPVVAALLVGGGAVFAFDHSSSGSGASAGRPAGAFGGAPGAFGGAPGGSGGGGGVAGEQRIQGTVTATTATSVTVKSSTGTATYTVNALTQIVRDGRTAPLSAVKAGEPVLVHVYPSASGAMLVERLFAGTSASDGGPGFGPPGANGTNGPSGTSGV